MTTPRVTVPVDPTALSVCRAIAPYLGATDLNDWSGLEDDDAISMPVKMRVGDLRDLKAVISAAPALEGGAVLAKRVSPGEAINRAVGDEVLTAKALESITTAGWVFAHKDDIATREEAPADNVTILITRAQREAAKNSGKKLNDWIGGILQRAVEDAPADSAHPCYDEHQAGCDCEILSQSATPTPSYLERLSAPAEAGEDVELIAALRSMPRCHCAGDDWPSLYDRAADRLEALRAQPQAREEAQPVGWISEAALRLLSNPDGSEKIYGNHRAANYKDDALAVYTHPAPDALRVAVEALKRIGSARDRRQPFQSDTELLMQVEHEASEALAALQAEQKGGA